MYAKVGATLLDWRVATIGMQQASDAERERYSRKAIKNAPEEVRLASNKEYWIFANRDFHTA